VIVKREEERESDIYRGHIRHGLMQIIKREKLEREEYEAVRWEHGLDEWWCDKCKERVNKVIRTQWSPDFPLLIIIQDKCCLWLYMCLLYLFMYHTLREGEEWMWTHFLIQLLSLK